MSNPIICSPQANCRLSFVFPFSSLVFSLRVLLVLRLAVRLCRCLVRLWRWPHLLRSLTLLLRCLALLRWRLTLLLRLTHPRCLTHLLRLPFRFSHLRCYLLLVLLRTLDVRRSLGLPFGPWSLAGRFLLPMLRLRTPGAGRRMRLSSFGSLQVSRSRLPLLRSRLQMPLYLRPLPVLLLPLLAYLVPLLPGLRLVVLNPPRAVLFPVSRFIPASPIVLQLAVRNRLVIPGMPAPIVASVVTTPAGIDIVVETGDIVIVEPAAAVVMRAIPATVPKTPPPAVPEEHLSFSHVRHDIDADGVRHDHHLRGSLKNDRRRQ